MPSLLPLVLAAATARPAIRAERADVPPVIDGAVDEAVWQKAKPSGTFTQKLPVDGTAPSEPTQIRVLYDDRAIYVAVECTQKTSTLVMPLTRRDRDVETDYVAVSFATRDDSTTAFEFAINPAGVLKDATRFDDTEYSTDWDGVWVGKATKTKDGWSAELEIPLRVLRFEERPVQSFGFQVRRYTSRRKETDEWAHIPRSVSGEVSRYGRLENLVGLKKGNTFEVRPFVAGRIGSRDPAVAPHSQGFAPYFSVGADFKWLVLPSLTLDGAINPDFGQVDADKVVLNLSSFENYFPEKRPFFLEAADVFKTPLQLIYTRRIGLAAPPPALREGEDFVATPDPSPIYGALKLTGNIGKEWSTGALLAVAGGTSAELLHNGRPVNRVASPLSTFKALRLRRNFEGGSNVGLLATAVSRLETPGDYALVGGDGDKGPRRELCPGGEELVPGQRCFHNAYVLAADGRIRFLDNNYSIQAQAAATVLDGGPPVELRDGNVIRSREIGPAARVQFRKDGGGNIRGGATYDIHGKTAYYNDLGFMQRQNRQLAEGWIEWDTNGPFSRFNDGFIGVYAWDTENLDWVNTGRGGGLFMGAQLKNFWRLFFEANATADWTDDREIGDGSRLQRAGTFGFDVGVNTDERAPVLFNIYGAPRFLTNGAFSAYIDATLRVRALPQLEMELTPGFTYTSGEPRFWGRYGDTYLFGELTAASLSATLSATYTFLPVLTFQAYAQAFTAYGRYSEWTSYSTPLPKPSVTFATLKAAAAPEGEEPTFASGAFNVNLVLRWEYRLGSTLFLVYSHGQSDDITPRFDQAGSFDLRLMVPRKAADVFLIKAAHWWG
ncbi:MAG: DUF5916 domain-containing protein [Polyangiaceae bacterium]